MKTTENIGGGKGFSYNLGLNEKSSLQNNNGFIVLKSNN
jgi:hypothetical protein